MGKLAAGRPRGGGQRATGRRPDRQVGGWGWGVGVGVGIHRKQLQPHLRTGAGWLHRENLPPSEPPPQRLPHHTYPFLQLKDQPGDPVPQRFTLRSWNVAAGSPTWILLEFPQSRHPHHHHHRHHHRHTCVKKTRLLPKAVTTSEQMATSPCHQPSASLALCPLPGRGFLRPGCPGCWLRGLPPLLLAVVSLARPWL